MNFLKTLFFAPKNLRAVLDFNYFARNKFSFELFNSDLFKTVKSDVIPLYSKYNSYRKNIALYGSMLGLTLISLTILLDSFFLFCATVTFVIAHFYFSNVLKDLIHYIETVDKKLLSIENSAYDLTQVLNFQKNHPELVTTFKNKVFATSSIFNYYHFDRLEYLVKQQELSMTNIEASKLFQEFKTFSMDSNESSPEHSMQEVIAAHKQSSNHKAEVQSSEFCGCFHCLAVFEPKTISKWIDWPIGTPKEKQIHSGATAMCPMCGFDAVIGSNSGYPITKEFLARMQKHWFGG